MSKREHHALDLFRRKRRQIRVIRDLDVGVADQRGVGVERGTIDDVPALDRDQFARGDRRDAAYSPRPAMPLRRPFCVFGEIQDEASGVASPPGPLSMKWRGGS